jgi:hypothetical protein
MDIDHLIHRESEERLRAAKAACERSRDAHARLADMFRDRARRIAPAPDADRRSMAH